MPDSTIQALEQARALIQEQNEYIERIRSAPLGLGIVADVSGENTLLNTGQTIVQIKTPKDIDVKPGSAVTFDMGTSQIVGLCDASRIGVTADVSAVLSPKLAEVSVNGNTVIIHSAGQKVEEGDRVLVDRSGHVILGILEKAKQNFKPKAATQVTFDDIGGLEKTKATVREVIELPFRHPEIFAHYGKKQPKGILLFGPPGTGKTMLGKAISSMMAEIFADRAKCKKNEVPESGFVYIKSPEVLNMYVGASEYTIRQIFQGARIHHQKYGYPAVLFFDEADAVMGKRGQGIGSVVDRTIVPTFLTEMDGLEESNAIVVLATNRPDTLDPAVIREGRIDRKIRVSRPDEASLSNIIELGLRKAPLAKNESVKKIGPCIAAEFFSEKRVLKKISAKGQSIKIPLAALASGAIGAAIVEQGLGHALQRDLKHGTRAGATTDDFLKALEDIHASNAALENEDAAIEYMEDLAGSLEAA